MFINLRKKSELLDMFQFCSQALTLVKALQLKEPRLIERNHSIMLEATSLKKNGLLQSEPFT
jgi:hypothetical protein